MRLFICIIFFLIFISGYSFSSDTAIINNKKKNIVTASVITAYSGSLIYLHQIWYKPYATSHFHFFDDNSEWYKIDKLGHTFTAYYASYYLNNLFKYAGYKKPVIYATSIAWLYLLNIEILDGFSSGWGFSLGDFTANTIGAGLFLINQHFQQSLFVPKFSYYLTSYPSLNPTLLGSNDAEKIIKDYNGQTYWISISPFYKWKKNIEWLCISFGYGADGLIGARSNIYDRNGIHYNYSYIARQQQFYLSLDVDCSKIPTRKKWLKTLFKSIQWIKIPAPAIEWKGNNLYFCPLLFSN